MKKILFSIVIFLLAYATSIAQVNLKGTVEFNGSPLPGATVQLYMMQSDYTKGTSVGEDGGFELNGILKGDYRMVINFIGFKKYRKRISINEDTDLGVIELKEDIIEIEGVEITGSMIQAIQKGDTTVYNAGAFKTLADADAKQLIAKIPGIDIENGELQADGEAVNKVTVDGREFFGNDPNVALNAIPAEIIERVEIIEEQSESSQFTGFDDGNRTKTINIVTKPDKRNGEFGKMYGGFGAETEGDNNQRFQLGGNINFFNGNQRTSIIGLANNINQQNFSTDDLLGVVGGNNRRGRRGGGGGRRGGFNDFLVGQTDGIADTYSGGINFSDKWGEKVDFSGSYFYNLSQTISEQFIEQEFFDEEAEREYTEINRNRYDNTNHRAQGRLTINFDKKNRLLIRPRISWQGNDMNEYSDTELLRGSTSNLASNVYDATQTGINLSNSVQYRHAFEKKGRTISLSVNHSLQPKDGNNSLATTLSRDSTDTSTLQRSDFDSSVNGFGTEISYTEPINDKSRIMLEYELERDNGDNIEETVDATNAPIFLPELSSDQDNVETVHSMTAGYQWRNKKVNLVTRAIVENSNIDAAQRLPLVFETNKSYTNFLPYIRARIAISDSKNLSISYRPRTSNPSISQLSETVDNSNPLQLSKGNFNLDQSYQHNLSARYRGTNKLSGISYFVYMGGDFSDNYIGQRTYLSGTGVELYNNLGLDKRAQLELPENMEGYLRLRTYGRIGLPVTGIKSKLNLALRGNYTDTPSIIDDKNNSTKNKSIGFTASLTSNISDKVDFTLSSKTNYGSAENSLIPTFDTKYTNQATSFNIDALLPGAIIFRTDATHQIYSGYGEGFDDNFLLTSMSIGKKFLKNNRAEVSISVFDLFNQNQAISRNINAAYIENIENNVLQRYVMVNLRYDLRHFGTAPKNEKRGNRDSWRGGPPGGRRGE